MCDLVRFVLTCTFIISTFYMFLLIHEWRYSKSKLRFRERVKTKQALYYEMEGVLLLFTCKEISFIIVRGWSTSNTEKPDVYAENLTLMYCKVNELITELYV